MCKDYFCVIGIYQAGTSVPERHRPAVILGVYCGSGDAADETEDALRSGKYAQVRVFHQGEDKVTAQCYLWTANRSDAYTACLSACHPSTTWRAQAIAAIADERARDEAAIAGDVEFVVV